MIVYALITTPVLYIIEKWLSSSSSTLVEENILARAFNRRNMVNIGKMSVVFGGRIKHNIYIFFKGLRNKLKVQTRIFIFVDQAKNKLILDICLVHCGTYHF